MLLSGLIKCFECKKRIVLQRINNNFYTVCNTYKKYSKLHLCTSHSNNYKKIENIIINKLHEIINNVDTNIIINRELILQLINKIEIHENKTIDVYLNIKVPSFIAQD